MEARPAIRPSVVAGLAALALLSGCSHKTSHAASASSPKTALASPQAWPLYGLNAAHDARYKAPQGAAGEPVQWVFHVPGAVPNGMKKAAIKRTYVTITAVRDLVGIPIGASVADGNVYVPDDNGFLYALDGSDGHMLWKFNIVPHGSLTKRVPGGIREWKHGPLYVHLLLQVWQRSPCCRDAVIKHRMPPAHHHPRPRSHPPMRGRFMG